MTNAHEDTVLPSTISLGRFADGDLITKRELGKCLDCSDRTLQRMMERFEIPPPMALGGRKVWLAGKVRAWFTDAAERREAEALKEARRLAHGLSNRFRRQYPGVQIPRRHFPRSVGGAVVNDEGKPCLGADAAPQIQSAGVILQRSNFSPPLAGVWGALYRFSLNPSDWK